MGCWNGTCAITHAPVIHGDKVVVVLLVQQPSGLGESLCYSTAYWRPYPFYFEGEYNDYGAVEKCHGPMLPWILADLQDHLFEMDEGENKSHDIPVKKEWFDIDAMFEADHEGRLYIKHGWKMSKEPINRMRVKHVIIRKEVFDQLVAEHCIELYVRHPSGDWDKGEYVNSNVDRYITYADKFIDELMTEELEDLPGVAADTLKLLRRYKGFHTRETEFGRYCIEQFKYSDMTPPDFTISELVETGKNELARTAAHQVATLGWVCSYMDAGRYMWCPPSGAGSQNSDMDAQKLTAKLIETAAIAIEDRFKEYE